VVLVQQKQLSYRTFLKQKLLGCSTWQISLANLVASAGDMHHFDADPDAYLDPTFHIDADVDPTYHLDVYPDV
jgi:hypothetical protein